MFDDLRDLYQETILDHGRRPRHARRIEPADASARGDNPLCGDRVEVRLNYTPDGCIGEAGFEARGCAISVASADLMIDAVRGRRPEEARGLFGEFQTLVRTGACPDCQDAAIEALKPLAGVHEFPSRVKCATLPWHALIAALDGGLAVAHEGELS